MTKLHCCAPTNTITGASIKQLLIKVNTSLANLTRSNCNLDALHLFNEIHSSHHLKPDVYTLSTTLSASANLRNATVGNQLHAYAIRAGLKSYPHVANTILSLYKNTQDLFSVKRVFGEIENPDVYSWTTLVSACTKTGDVKYACEVFDKMPKRDLAVYNAIITGCSESGYEDIGIGFFVEMHKLGVLHDNYSFASVLSVCDERLVEFGRQVHSMVIKNGFLVRVSVINAVITMYFNCGNAEDACIVFEEARNQVCDNISFNVMMDGLASIGRTEEALVLFKDMLKASLTPSELTFVSVFSACSCPTIGNQIRAQAIKTGFEECTSVSNAVITMYSNCGDLDGAQTVFDNLKEKDLVSWNTMISSYEKGNLGKSAILAYLEMRRLGIRADEFTFGSLFAGSECVETVEMTHSLVIKNGVIFSIQVSNALVSAYSKHEYIDRAYQTFQEMSSRNLITWNTIMSGLLLNGFPMKSLEKFSELVMSKIMPDRYTLSIALSICASISSLRHGKEIHSYILTHNHLFSSISLGNALITMYSKCGDLDCSLRVFSIMMDKDTVSWNAIISAYAQHGKGREAVLCFQEMLNTIMPDNATFTAILSACSHSGLVNEAARIFDSMVNDYGVSPNEDHFSCMLDLLGRAGYLDEAERLMKKNQHIQVSSSIWWALFSACASHGNLRLGRTVAGYLLENEQNDPSVYVLLSNIYAASGQWEEAANVRGLLDRMGRLKQPGCSWIGS